MIHKLKRKLSRDNKVAGQEAYKQDEKNALESIIEEELHELEKDEVELFDDYLEMIMTYGYITLFASAFPFGSAITVVFIFIEIRSDIFKLERLAKRPMVKKTHDIGTWMFALYTLSYGAIFTNIILCCFASDQIDSILPYLKESRDFSKTAVVTVVSIEHVVMVFVLLLKKFYDTDPDWLKTYYRRAMHKQLKKQKISHD